MTVQTGYDHAKTPLWQDEHGDAPVRLRGRNDVREERRKQMAVGRETPVHSYNEHRILTPKIQIHSLPACGPSQGVPPYDLAQNEYFYQRR